MSDTPYVYLDWAATAPLSDAAVRAMRPFLQPGIEGLINGSGNANSLYSAGRTAFKALEQARETVARCVGARPDEITFTSGATEADNAALFGLVDAAVMAAEQRGDHECVPQVIVSAIEHDAVLEATHTLSGWGAEVVYVQPDTTGHITPAALEAVMCDRTILVSLMAVNNEVGSVMDVPALADAVHARGALFHVDATQALGKVPLNVRQWKVDALSLSSHKVGGPKGVGALYLKARTPFSAQLVGGGQENGRRSGTQNVAGAVGFAAACLESVRAQQSESDRLIALRDEAYRRFGTYERVTPSVQVPAGSKEFAPHIVNVLVRGIESETLILQLDRRGIFVSGGSACSSGSLDPSHVLSALNVPRDLALGSLRLSFGSLTTQEDLDRFFEAFDEVLR